MKKFYEEPKLEIRNYELPPSDVITTSVDLGDGPDYGYGDETDNGERYFN